MPIRPSALVVEDDADTRQATLEIVESEGFSVVGVTGLEKAREEIDRHGPFSIVLVDLSLPDGSGLELLADEARVGSSDVVVITGNASVETVVRSLREGAADYLTKPVDVDRLCEILGDTRLRAGTEPVDSANLEQAKKLGRFQGIIGASKPMLQVFRQIQRVAPAAATVLIQGDTGTGKEMVAQSIHELSTRSDGPFIALNCGAVSGTLIESELFGHEKGSFTGATKRHLGVFERAHGGTLFLDEITEMALDLQVKLLRVLETGTFSRVGGEVTIHSDARLVAATNRDPEQAIRDGKLREDLFYRLRVFPIGLPSLSRREGDVELLARRFVAAINVDNGIDKELGDDAVKWLEAQPWPGNVRELKNRMTRAWIMADDVIDLAAVSEGLEESAAGSPSSSAAEIRIPVGSSIADAERQLILATLRRFDDNKNTAARVLGISVKTLYNRLSVYAASGEG